MSVTESGNITAILKLETTEFSNSIEKANTLVGNFEKNLTKAGKNSAVMEMGVQSMTNALNALIPSLNDFNTLTSKVSNFNKFANGVNKIAVGLAELGKESVNAEQSINVMNNLMKQWQNTVTGTEIKVKGLKVSNLELANSANTAQNRYAAWNKTLANSRMSWVSADNTLMTLGRNIQNFNNVVTGADGKVKQFNTTLDSSKSKINSYRIAFTESANSATRFSTSLSSLNATLVNTTQRQANMGNALRNTTTSLNTTSSATSRLSTSYGVLDGKINSTVGKTQQLTTANNTLSNSKQRVSSSSSSASSSISRVGSSASSATGQVNKLATANSRLAKTMSSLKMMGSLVGSMLAYNFAHKLLVATGETIHAKSEMEGYFKMLNFGQRDINSFNQALDRTVQQFQRVNKYNLGETISSIGVEFDLSTKEMEKAMKVTSMVTSEYLRAGRNANEASLAVKDVLQGQFQRLSRETGVKGEQLKEAGWSGDTTDVLSLMEALEKVGESRHWDLFASKANSLNDILTILQNRFGEWSAEMVNIVQPSIVNAFNAIMSVMGGLSNIAGGFWTWLNTDGWGQTAVKIGAVGTALLSVTQAFTMYRTGMSMVQIAQMGFTKTLTSVVLGLKSQEIAENGVRNAIMSKILGVKAETIAESGVANAILERVTMTKLETVQQQLNTLASEENTTAKKYLAIQEEILKMQDKGRISEMEAKTLLQQLETAITEEQTVANGGLTASLYALGTGEALVTGETGALATAWGVLNGVFMLSPIGWITAGILGLAGAVYVLTGGLNDCWGSFQRATDAVENSAEAIKPYKNYVEQTNQELEDAKQKYGENSLIVEQLSKKYDLAKYSLDGYYKKLQSTTAMHDKLNEELGVTSAKMDEIMRTELGDLGYDQSQIDEMTTGISDLDRLWDHDYVALQKHNKMMGNFSSDIHDYAERVGGDAEAIKEYGKAYSDFIHYSDEANTADNWWDWATNSFMAGLSSDSMKFQELIHGSFDSTFGESMGKELFDSMGSWINGIGDQWNSYWNNLDLAGSINNAWQGVSEWVQSLDLGKMIGDWLSSLPDPSADFSEWLAGAWINFGASVQGFFDDPLGAMSITLPEGWSILSLLGFDAVSAADGSETPSFMEDLSNILGFNIQTWLDSFSADPLGTLGVTGGAIDLYNFFSGLITSNIEGISLWVDENIVQPLSTGISNGIANIPILGDIAQLLGLIPNENQDASNKGDGLGDSIGSGLTTAIGNIPVLGNILKALGIIPQANPTARSHGQGVGDNASQGYFSGTSNLISQAVQEFQDIANGIRNKIGEAFSAAQAFGQSMWNGLNSVMQRASPGFFHDQTLLEFGTDIPNAIRTSADTAYSDAQYYGSMIKQGIADSGTTTIGMDGMVADYQSDAQIISDSSQLMGMTTSTAFNDMQMSVNTSTSQMASNVNTQYTSMQQKQASLLTNMKTSNTSAYNEMYQKSNTSLLQMRDSTSNITHQMTNAWNTMKNNIVASAHKLKTDSTVHFNTLSNTIGSFYRKIQNPSSWGSAGSPKFSSGKRNTSAGKIFTSTIKHAAGGWTGRDTMTISALKRKLCPNGDCDGIFDNFKSSDVVNVSDFLSLMIPEGHGFGGWSFNNSHYNHIKNTSDKWGMKSPTINLKGGIPTNADYKVGDFENGAPNISFSSFQSMAESIFSAIPYRFYYDSDWKGSWLGALQAGACNCWDGAHALVAFANSCGFNGGIQHGTWVDPDGTTYPHVYAVINGKKMDTTGWQQRRSWSAGSPNTISRSSGNSTHNTKTINVTVDMSGATIYGVDDLESKIKDGVDKGLKEHFNDPYTVSI